MKMTKLFLGILLAGSIGAALMPIRTYAKTTIRQGNKIINTTTSESLAFDGSMHESTVYAGEIKKNNETVLSYLFSEDISRSSVVFDNLRKALPNPFSDMVPSIIGEDTKKGLKETSADTVNNIDLATISGDWKDADSIATQIYNGKNTDVVNSNMYDVNEQCKSDIDELARGREGIDEPIPFDKRIVSHLGTETTDNLKCKLIDSQLIEVHDVNLIYLSEATALIYTSVNVIDKTEVEDIKAPQARALTYNGQAQALVTAGSAVGGTMQYAIGKDPTTVPTTGWNTSVPTATDAGTYYVWYMVKGDASHKDSEVKGPVKVEIASASEPDPEPDPDPESETISIKDAKVILQSGKLVYNGKNRKPIVKTVNGLALAEGKDYTVTIKNSKGKTVQSYKSAGTYTLVISGKGNYTGSTTTVYKIVKAKNTLNVVAKNKKHTLQQSKLSNKNQTIKKAKLFKFKKKGKGKTTYSVTSAKKDKKSFKKYFSINKKGNLTIKKGLEKGSYKVKVKVKAKGNTNYKAGTKLITFTINVK